jgi:hypothetical protein
MNRGIHMRNDTRKQRKLELRKERLRVLEAGALDQVAGGHSLARIGTRLCLTGVYEP